MTVVEYEQAFYDYFYEKNIPHSSICATMGNIKWESGFEPDKIEIQTGIGFGLCQWSYGRRIQLESYGTDFQRQLEFLNAELTNDSTDVGEGNYNFQWIETPPALDGTYTYSHDLFMSGEDTLTNLTYAFMWCFERPSVTDGNNSIQYRLEYAENYYTSMTYQGSGESPDPDPDPEPTPDPDPDTPIIEGATVRVNNICTINKRYISNVFGGTFRNLYDTYVFSNGVLYVNNHAYGKVKDRKNYIEEI